MFKTIFRRILTSNFLLIFLSMVIVSICLFSFLGRYAISEKEIVLLEEADRVNELTVFYINNRNPKIDIIYSMNINYFSRRIDGVIFIVNQNSEIVVKSENAAKYMKVDSLPKDVFSQLFDNAGKAHLSNLQGVFPEIYLFVSVPIKYNNEIIGASCLAVPMPEINRYRTDIFRTALISIAIAIVIACVISYFISRKISNPLKRMNIAAQKIAMGNFDIVIPVHGRDEVAQLGATFNKMTDSLRELEKMRSSFIANVSHELRTPMTTISGFIEGIMDGTIPEENREQYLRIVLDESRRLSRLVSELLTLARIDEGRVKFNYSEFDINELIRVTILRFEKEFTENNINAEINFEKDECFVKADKDAITRVLINLFDNALKFNINNGYVKISVEEKDGKAVISVENSGIGIKKEELRLIWDRFYKSDMSRSRDKKGMGLGLYLVHNIISAHNEKIKVESLPGKFTRFTFTLKKI